MEQNEPFSLLRYNFFNEVKWGKAQIQSLTKDWLRDTKRCIQPKCYVGLNAAKGLFLGQTERIAAIAASFKEMELLNFLNNNLHDWEDILSREPYYLKITYDGPYVMLKYQQFMSDMRLIIC